MISEKLKLQLSGWEILFPFFETQAWLDIKNAIKPDFFRVSPSIDSWFKAFTLCSYKDTKVVWVGQSPYFTIDGYSKEVTADGLCFSTNIKNNVPPSLFKIYKAIEYDLWNGCNRDMDRTNNLEYLAKQGVLLLNSALTTIIGSADSHIEVWRPFIDYVVKVLNEKEDLVVVTFGKVAKEAMINIDSKHMLVNLEHPAKAAYENRAFKHENCFSKINEYLVNKNKEEIKWDQSQLVEEQVPF